MLGGVDSIEICACRIVTRVLLLDPLNGDPRHFFGGKGKHNFPNRSLIISYPLTFGFRGRGDLSAENALGGMCSFLMLQLPCVTELPVLVEFTEANHFSLGDQSRLEYPHSSFPRKAALRALEGYLAHTTLQ